MHTNQSPSQITLAGLARSGIAEQDRERAQIYLCLAEAPAFPRDLAGALGLAPRRLQEHLDALTAVGLIGPHERDGEIWYRVLVAAGPLVAQLLTDRIHTSPHRAPTAPPLEGRS